MNITFYDTAADKAADRCHDYSIVNNGVIFNDWRLPSIGNLGQIYVNLKVPGVA